MSGLFILTLASGNPQLLAETATICLLNPSIIVGKWGARTTTAVLDWPGKGKTAHTQEKKYFTTTYLV